jgi:hypothetical protein
MSTVLWVIVVVCFAGNPKDCKQLVSEEAASTPAECFVEGEILAAMWVHDHDGWKFDGTVRCEKERPIAEERT